MDNVAAQQISEGATALGIELGSTRIKAVLINREGQVLATGGYDWENQFVDRVWTYPLEQVWEGLRSSYQALARQVRERYGVEIEVLGSIGISAMMHGYLVFDSEGRQLAPFQTWRNSNTEEAASLLTGLFNFNIPQRWCVAHLAQAVLDHREHVEDIAYMTTLAGLVHWQLTGQKVVGVGDASGMLPIDPKCADFYPNMLDSFDEYFAQEKLPWKIRDILPTVLVAGQEGGRLTKEGALILDPTGRLQSGALIAPPEGDGATGMVATNSVTPRTGNTSAGTSIFTMVVMEHELAEMYPEIDVINTPQGDAVAMIHCNNGASELNAWVGLFAEFIHMRHPMTDIGSVFEDLFAASLHGDTDCGGLLAYNYLAGETITGTAEGRPLFVRTPDSEFSLANFMRAQIYGVFGTLALGMKILRKESIALDRMLAHGGLFKTEYVGQSYLAAALNTPVSVAENAGEGGAWGIAVLAAYAANGDDMSLATYLDDVIFAEVKVSTCDPDPRAVQGFAHYLARYERALPVERMAVDCT